jgi:hypothetical protein
MTNNQFSWQSFNLRLIFAVLLVFLTYNPSGYSFYHWSTNALFGDQLSITPPFALSGIILIIGWTVYIRATLNALGGLGLTLAFLFFGVIVWWIIDLGLLSLDRISILTYIVLFLLSAVLATGMSWSHIRRRLSGQVDVDDIED